MDLEIKKIQIVFNHLSMPDVIKGETRVEKMLDYIKEQESLSFTATNKTHIYVKWIHQLLDKWNSEFPDQKQLAMVFQLINILSIHKQKFLLLQNGLCIDRTIEAYKLNCNEELVTIAFINMLRGLTSNSLGKEWLTSSITQWSIVFELNQKYRSPAVTKALSKFIGDLYLTVGYTDNQFFIDVCHIFLKPFYDVNTKVNTCIMVCQSETDLHKEVSPTLYLVHDLCLYLSKKIKSLNQWTVLYNILFSFQKLLYTLLKNITDEHFSFQLSQAILPLHFLEIAKYLQNSQDDFRPKFVKHLVRSMQINISRFFTKNTFQLLTLCQIYWTHVFKIMELNRYPFNFCFQKDIMLLQMVPLIEINLRVLGREQSNVFEDGEFRETYLDNCCADMDLTVVHLWYKIRDAMGPKPCIVEDAATTIDFLLDTKQLLNRKNVIILLKFCIYFIEDIVGDINKTRVISSTEYNSDFLEVFLNLFIIFVEDFDLSWSDGIEIIHMLNRIIEFLQLSDLSDKLVIQALKLLDISISRCLSPNLALLIDSDDETTNFIGPLLYTKIRDSNPKVRIQSLKVFYTLSENAISKYPFFKKIILASELHKTTMKILFSKDESESRKMAAKCLQQIVLVDELWDELLQTPNMLDSLIDLLKMEADNAVKAELVSAVGIIYKEDHLTTKNIQELCNILVTSAYNLDENVRINVLLVWDTIINKLFSEEGMIDGDFPEYTFSKQLRKIVHLQEQEVTKRIVNVMNQLSRIGCFSVLVQRLKTDNKNEKKVLDSIIDKIKSIIEKYNIDINNKSKDCNEITSMKDKQNFENVDMLIEHILEEECDNEIDICTEFISAENFLVNIYENPEECNSLECKNDFSIFLDEIVSSYTVI